MGRRFTSEVHNKSPTVPFNIRYFSDSNMAKVGISECLRHELLTTYPVMTEKKVVTSDILRVNLWHNSVQQ